VSPVPLRSQRHHWVALEVDDPPSPQLSTVADERFSKAPLKRSLNPHKRSDRASLNRPLPIADENVGAVWQGPHPAVHRREPGTMVRSGVLVGGSTRSQPAPAARRTSSLNRESLIRVRLCGYPTARQAASDVEPTSTRRSALLLHRRSSGGPLPSTDCSKRWARASSS
jgi:hypothetical protein